MHHSHSPGGGLEVIAQTITPMTPTICAPDAPSRGARCQGAVSLATGTDAEPVPGFLRKLIHSCGLSDSLLHKKVTEAAVHGPLSEGERLLLPRLVEAAKRRERAFIELGQVLLFIRDRRLYREEHGTFEEFVRAELGYGRAHCYRLISAAQVIALLSPKGDILPCTERQMRPLYGLMPEEILAVWEEAVARSGNGPVKPRVIEEAAARFRKPRAEVSRNRPKPEQNPRRLLGVIRDLSTLNEDDPAALALLARLKSGMLGLWADWDEAQRTLAHAGLGRPIQFPIGQGGDEVREKGALQGPGGSEHGQGENK